MTFFFELTDNSFGVFKIEENSPVDFWIAHLDAGEWWVVGVLLVLVTAHEGTHTAWFRVHRRHILWRTRMLPSL